MYKEIQVKIIFLIIIAAILSACASVDSSKYIGTDNYVAEMTNDCLDSNAYEGKPAATQQRLCSSRAKSAMETAKVYYKLYSRDEADYEACQKQFGAPEQIDLCFKAMQHKYYKQNVNAVKWDR